MRTEELMRKAYPTQYQEALLFKLAFQKFNHCLKFRKAWKISDKGFVDYREYNIWYNKLLENSNKYLTSKKYKDYQQQVVDKRKDYHQGKITKNDLELFATQVHLTIPIQKYEFDIDQITICSGKPTYWRYFVERCLLFDDFEISPITRPLPEPKLCWDSYNRVYELFIENIFPDTTTKDFDNPSFTRRFRELQKKLPGYQFSRPRLKKKIEYDLKVLELDLGAKLSDSEKTEEIEGEVDSLDFGVVEKKRTNKLKQTRYRLRKYIGKLGSVKQRS